MDQDVYILEEAIEDILEASSLEEARAIALLALHQLNENYYSDL
jgi:hypothetical protein